MNDTYKSLNSILVKLGVTMGTLTTGINGLVKKGYVERHRSDKDRRIVYASLTTSGHKAYNHHMKFHKDMIDYIMNELSEDEAKILGKTFVRLEDYFEKWL